MAASDAQKLHRSIGSFAPKAIELLILFWTERGYSPYDSCTPKDGSDGSANGCQVTSGKGQMEGLEPVF